jgi:hypothetical protein
MNKDSEDYRNRENSKRMLATQNFTNIRRVDGFKHMDVTLGGDVIGFVRYKKATEAFWKTVSVPQWKGPVDTRVRAFECILREVGAL